MPRRRAQRAAVPSSIDAPQPMAVVPKTRTPRPRTPLEPLIVSAEQSAELANGRGGPLHLLWQAALR